MQVLPDFPEKSVAFCNNGIPKCKYGILCNNNTENHRKSFKHIKIPCVYGKCCKNHNYIHRKCYIH